MTLHRKKPKMARAWWRRLFYGRDKTTCTPAWWACYRWHKAVKP